MITTLLLLCFLAGVSDRSSLDVVSSTPLEYPVAVKVTSPRNVYRDVAHSTKEIDFKNLTYHLLGERIRLHNGFMRGNAHPLEGEEYPPHIEVTLKRISYFDFQNGHPRSEERRVGKECVSTLSLDFFSVGASSSDIGLVLVFGIVDNHPVVMQQFEYDRQAPGAGDNFDEETGALTIKARARDDSPRCCPENLETDEFKWQGQAFRLIHRKILSLAKSKSN